MTETLGMRSVERSIEKSTSVLIVDDEAFVRTALQLYLETTGFRVLVAENGHEALEVCRHEAGGLDVMILDLLMPGLSGMEVLRQIKTIDDSVEVIIATGCGSMTSAIEALRHGAYDYITKPIVNLETDLLKVVKEAAASRRARLCRGTECAVPAGTLEALRGQVALFEDIEALGLSAAGMESPGAAMQAVGRFLEEHLAAEGAMTLARADGDGGTSMAAWGTLVDLPPAVVRGLSDLAGPRERTAARPEASWKRLSRDAASAIDPTGRRWPRGLEVLRVPILPASTTRWSEAEADLLVVRPPSGSEARPAHGLTLLGLVLARLFAPIAVG